MFWRWKLVVISRVHFIFRTWVEEAWQVADGGADEAGDGADAGDDVVVASADWAAGFGLG